MCMHQLTLHPNLKHASERVERPGGSHEGFGRKKSETVSCVVGSWADRVWIMVGSVPQCKWGLPVFRACAVDRFFLTGALCLSAGRGVLRLTRLPRHDGGPVPGGNRSAASCLCTVLRRALYHYPTRSPMRVRSTEFHCDLQL